MTEPTIIRPLPLSTPSETPTVNDFSASLWMSITENFNASAAAFAACLSSARNHDACVRSGPWRGQGWVWLVLHYSLIAPLNRKGPQWGPEANANEHTLLDGLLQSVRSWATPKFRGSARRRAKSRDGTGGSRVARRGCVSARARTGAQYKIS